MRAVAEQSEGGDFDVLPELTVYVVGEPRASRTLPEVPYDPKALVPVARVTSTVVTLAVPASSSATWPS